MQRYLFAALVISLAGCTTYKLWNDAGSDSDLGTVKLSYEYRKYESPQVDERAEELREKERQEAAGSKQPELGGFGARNLFGKLHQAF